MGAKLGLRRLPTLKDVAELAGVHPATVSRVLRGDGKLRVSAETRERILTAAARLKYQPHSIGRSLKLRRSFTLALVLPDVGNPVFPEIIKGAERGVAERGYSLVLVHLEPTGPGPREQPYLRLVRQNRVDGLLLATAELQDGFIQELAELGVPFVLVNRRWGELPRYVIADDQAGAKLAVSHLVGLGHRQIAHLAGPLSTDTARRRFEGYQEGLLVAGLPFQPELVEECGYSWEGGVAGARRLLSRRPRPTAVFATNLLVAAGAMLVIREHGLQVPADISVVGFHDAPLAQVFNPPLTTVVFPLYRMGYEAARALVGLIEGERNEVRVVLPPDGLVVRESTAPPPKEVVDARA
ncbi:MAG: LacI family transcriptional regulator [Chloroflexota bacterium]